MNLLGINEQRKYTFAEIEKYKALYQKLREVNDKVDNFRKTGFSSLEERLKLNTEAWKSVREYETQVPEDIQQVLSFDTVKFSEKMVYISKQQINLSP